MLLVIEWRERGSAGVDPAARRGDDDALAPRQSLRAVFGKAKGPAHHRQPVDPRLELARDAEVIHRRADYDDIGGEKRIERGIAYRRIFGKRGAFGNPALP